MVKLRDLLDAVGAAMQSKWSAEKDCIVFMPRSAVESDPVTRASQIKEISTLLSKLSPEQMRKLTTGSLSAKSLDPDASKTLMGLARSHLPGSSLILRNAWDKADIYLRPSPAVDILDENGRVVQTVTLFSTGAYMLPSSPIIAEDSTVSNVKLAEELIKPPAVPEPDTQSADFREVKELALNELAKKVQILSGVKIDFDPRLRDSKYIVAGVILKKDLPDIIRKATQVNPTERIIPNDDWAALIRLLDGPLKPFIDDNSKLDYLDLTASDFVGRKQMTLADLGKDAITESFNLQKLNLPGSTRIQLRPGFAFVVDPHELRPLPEPGKLNGETVTGYQSYMMGWTLRD